MPYVFEDKPSSRFIFEEPEPSYAQKLGGEFVEGSKKLGKSALALGELAGHLGSGMVAFAPSLVVGAAEIISGVKASNALADMESVVSALTYMPQTELGKELVQEGLGPIFEKLGYPGKYLREKGYPEAGASYDIGVYGAMAALPLLRKGKGKGIPKTGELYPEATGLGTPELTGYEPKMLTGHEPKLLTSGTIRPPRETPPILRKAENPVTGAVESTPEIYVRDSTGKETLISRPKKAYEGKVPIIGEEVSAVEKAMSRRGFERTAEDLLALKKERYVFENELSPPRPEGSRIIEVEGRRYKTELPPENPPTTAPPSANPPLAEKPPASPLRESPKVKEPWEMTKKEFINAGPEGYANEGNYGWSKSGGDHSVAVKDALENGKPVPSEVLKDYPFLGAKSPKGMPESFAGTKVSDPSGRPLKMYHASDKPVSEFVSGKEINFSDKPMTKEFGENVYEAYLDIKKPASSLDEWMTNREKYDGAFWKSEDYEGKPGYFARVKDASQIKVVSKTEGTPLTWDQTEKGLYEGKRGIDGKTEFVIERKGPNFVVSSWDKGAKQIGVAKNLNEAKALVEAPKPPMEGPGKVGRILSSEKGQLEIPNPERFLNSFAKFFDIVYTLPEKNSFLRMRYKTLGFLDRIDHNVIGPLTKKLNAIEPETRKKMFQYLDGELELIDLPPEVRVTSRNLRTINNLVGKMLVKRGLLDEEVFLKYKNQYVRYLYLKHILGEDTQIRPSVTGKLDLSYLKARKDLTTEQKKALGWIEDVAVAEPYGLTKPLRDIFNYDYMDFISQNREWTWQPSVVRMGRRRIGMGDVVKELDTYNEMVKRVTEQEAPEIYRERAALQTAYDYMVKESGHAPEEFGQLPTSKSYGPLSGAFVRKEIIRDIMPVVTRFADKSVLSKSLNALIDIEEKGMGLFKVSKIAVNVPTMARNTVSNIIQLNISGMNYPEIANNMNKAAQSMYKQDAVLKQARRFGVFKTNWGEAEIAEVLKTVKQIDGNAIDSVLAGAQKLASYYGKIDDFFKLTKFHEQISKGVEPGMAAIQAQKWGMDYSLAHPLIKGLRRHIMPFVSYQYKIAPLIAEAMVKRPWVLAKYMAIPFVAKEAFKQINNINDDEWKNLEKNLSSFIRKSGSYAVLPWESPEGRWQWVNLEYFFPWGNYYQIYRDVINKESVGEFMGDVGIGNPFVQIFATLASSRRDNPPVDMFTHQPIYGRLDPGKVKAEKMVEWLYNQWAPGMLTRYGALGYSVSVGDKDRYGRTITPQQAFARWFGVNIIEPVPRQAALERIMKRKLIETELYKVQRDSKLSKEEKLDRIREYKKQLKEIYQ